MTAFIGDYPLARNARLTFYEKENTILYPLETFTPASTSEEGRVGLLFAAQLKFRSASFDYLEGQVKIKSGEDEIC